MKVESKNDVQVNQRLDQPVLNPATVAMPTKAADELSFLFSQEVDANSRPLSERKMGVPIPPVEHMVQLYDQLGHPAKRPWQRSPVESGCYCCRSLLSRSCWS
jgi:type III secretion protein W